MTDYTRVTIQGEGRKADLVLPDDEPLAAVLPEVLSLLGETTTRSSRPVVLMTTVGEQLSSALTLAEQDVEHGTILRLVRVDEAPPPPEVADVTDVMADATTNRSDAWRAVWGVLAAAAVALVLGALTAPVAVASGLEPGRLGVVAAVLAAGAVLAGRRRRPGPAAVLAAAAAGWSLPVAQDLVGRLALDSPGATALVWFGLVAVLVAVVAVAGLGDLPLALGGAVGAVLVAGGVVMQLMGMAPTHVAAVVAVAAALVLGVIPGLAMTLSGLTGLDDRVVEGRRAPRAAVERAVDGTHRALTWATVAAVVPSAVAAWSLARGEDPVGHGVAAAVGLVLLLRTQVLPLAPQRLALIGGGSVALLTLAFSSGVLTPAQTTLVVGAAVLVLAGVVGSAPSENTRARLRRFAGVLELVAVVALVPLVLALLGVFADLVDAF